MTIEIFVGFQFVSEYFSKIKIEANVSRAVQHLNKEIARKFPKQIIKLKYQVIDIDSGKNLLNFLSEKISKSDICIFELSNKNANVLFELGFAYALKKK